MIWPSNDFDFENFQQPKIYVIDNYLENIKHNVLKNKDIVPILIIDISMLVKTKPFSAIVKNILCCKFVKLVLKYDPYYVDRFEKVIANIWFICKDIKKKN